jgi:hypothetical protein
VTLCAVLSEELSTDKHSFGIAFLGIFASTSFRRGLREFCVVETVSCGRKCGIVLRHCEMNRENTSTQKTGYTNPHNLFCH